MVHGSGNGSSTSRSASGSSGPLKIGAQRATRFAKSGARLASASQINSGGVFGSTSPGGSSGGNIRILNFMLHKSFT